MAFALPIAIGAMAIGTGMSIFGALQQGAYEARTAKKQAKLATLQSKAEEERADEEAINMRDSALEMAGYQRAAYAAAGVDLTGTPMLVVSQTLRDSERDIGSMFKESSARRLDYITQSSIYSDTAKYAKTASYWKAGSTLLTGIGEGVSTWGTWKN